MGPPQRSYWDDTNYRPPRRSFVVALVGCGRYSRGVFFSVSGSPALQTVSPPREATLEESSGAKTWHRSGFQDCRESGSATLEESSGAKTWHRSGFQDCRESGSATLEESSGAKTWHRSGLGTPGSQDCREGSPPPQRPPGAQGRALKGPRPRPRGAQSRALQRPRPRGAQRRAQRARNPPVWAAVRGERSLSAPERGGEPASWCRGRV